MPSPFLLQVVASGIAPGGLPRVTANPEIIPGQKSASGKFVAANMACKRGCPKSLLLVASQVPESAEAHVARSGCPKTGVFG